MSDQTVLDGLDIPTENGSIRGRYGAGPTEQETLAAIAEIEAEGTPLTGAKRTIKRLCISLAESIDAGNRKGRAIANEAAQLLAMMQQLDPLEADADVTTDNFPPELKALIDAFQSAPRLDPAPQGDAERL